MDLPPEGVGLNAWVLGVTVVYTVATVWLAWLALASRRATQMATFLDHMPILVPSNANLPKGTFFVRNEGRTSAFTWTVFTRIGDLEASSYISQRIEPGSETKSLSGLPVADGVDRDAKKDNFILGVDYCAFTGDRFRIQRTYAGGRATLDASYWRPYKLLARKVHRAAGRWRPWRYGR